MGTPLQEAVRTGGDREIDILRRLLDEDADPDEASAADDWPPLHIAVSLGQLACVTALLQAGAEPDTLVNHRRGAPAAAAASSRKDHRSRASGKQSSRTSALHLALEHPDALATEICAQLLHEGGADPLVRNGSGCTPASVASATKRHPQASFLLQREQEVAHQTALLSHQ